MPVFLPSKFMAFLYKRNSIPFFYMNDTSLGPIRLVYEGHRTNDCKPRSDDCAGKSCNGGIDFPSKAFCIGRTFACHKAPLRPHKHWMWRSLIPPLSEEKQAQNQHPHQGQRREHRCGDKRDFGELPALAAATAATATAFTTRGRRADSRTPCFTET